MDSSDRVPVPEKLQPLLAQSPVLFAMQSQASHMETFHWVGPNIRHLLGYTQEEACREGWWFEHIHSDDRTHVHDKFQTAIERQTDQIIEYRFATKDGTYRHIRTHVHIPADQTH